MNSERSHAEAEAETGFWGRAGAGCLMLARSTGKFLFAYRSKDVNEPHTWGTWGGAIDSGLSPVEAVRREVQQEAGLNLNSELIPLFVFASGSFRYHNFLAIVPEEFSPRLNWETEAFRWTPFGKWPSPLHPGAQALLGDPRSLEIMRDHSNQ